MLSPSHHVSGLDFVAASPSSSSATNQDPMQCSCLQPRRAACLCPMRIAWLMITGEAYVTSCADRATHPSSLARCEMTVDAFDAETKNRVDATRLENRNDEIRLFVGCVSPMSQSGLPEFFSSLDAFECRHRHVSSERRKTNERGIPLLLSTKHHFSLSRRESSSAFAHGAIVVDAECHSR